MILEVSKLKQMVVVDGENYFKFSKPDSFLNEGIVKMLEKWDIDSDMVDEVIHEKLYELFMSKENDLYSMIDYYEENADYYLSKVKEIQKDKMDLGIE